MTPSDPRPVPVQRERASIACHRCHRKKIRCDAAASQGHPCANCAAHKAECILIESRRGRYPRKGRNRKPINKISNDVRLDAAGDETSQFDVDPSHTETASPITEAQNVTEQLTYNRLPISIPSLIEPTGGLRRLRSQDRTLGVEPSANDTDEHSPQMLYAQIAERSVSANLEPIRHTGESAFLGETFSLTYVVHEVLAPFLSKAPQYQKRLHFPIVNNALRHERSQITNRSVANEQINILKRQGIYSQLSPPMLEHLLQLYFDHFHPAFPIVEKSKFINAARAEQQSQLVLNAMLMIAVTVCSGDILRAAGFQDRHAARSSFYHQARYLYDSDAELDKLDNIRGVFLISFWWGGPNDQKDSWYWMGVAISLAQSLGLHRSTRRSMIERRKATSWKLIWWSLRVRDALISASIGRPQHIWRNDCDVELIELDDVSEELADRGPEVSNYFIQMAKLSVLVSRIIASRYSNSLQETLGDDRLSLESAMTEFSAEIPIELRYESLDPSTGRGLWASMLTMAFNYAMILLCRPSHTPQGDQRAQEWGNTSKAVTAANAVTRATEDLLSESMISLAQVHTIAALFNTLAVHVYLICRSDAITRGLAEARAKMCMMGLASLQESWSVGGWVLKLFISIMDRLKTHSQEAEASRKSRRPTTQRNSPIREGCSEESASQLTFDARGGSDSHAHTDASLLSASHLHPTTSIEGGNGFGADYSQYASGPLGMLDDSVPNIFAFDDIIGQPGSDGENFFHLLDFASMPDFGIQNPWPN